MKQILMIDDDKELLDSTREILESHKYGFSGCSSGEAGVRMAKQKKPDLIILDVMMSHDREGFEVAQTLNKDPDTKGVPVLLMTGISKAKGLPFKFEPDPDWLPVKAVLNKPVSPEDLLAKVKAAVGA